jgi:hypothetical protein
MIRSSTLCLLRCLLSVCAILVLLQSVGRAQGKNPFDDLPGTSLGGVTGIPFGTGYEGTVWSQYDIWLVNQAGKNTSFYDSKDFSSIADVYVKRNFVLLNTLLLLYDQGVLADARWNVATENWDALKKDIDIAEAAFQFVSQTFRMIFGDATYALSSSFVYVCRDSSLKTWVIDTTGLGSAYVTGLAADSGQYVYAAASDGFYWQHPDSNVWHRSSTFPSAAGSLWSVFIDRMGRFFVSSNYKGVYISTNRGVTWSLDTAGMGFRQIQHWSDDAFGNVYADNFRSSGGSGPWTDISTGLTAITVTQTGMRVNGDSTLYAATRFGLFKSTDHGTTWVESNGGIAARSFYGFARPKSGRWFTSTDLGIFSKNVADTSWTKSFPSSGYFSGLQLFGDKEGNMHATYSPTSYTFVALKSTDSGVTWGLDTAGMPANSRGPFFVDEAGTEHLQASFPGKSYADAPYYKVKGGSWTIDTSGIIMKDYGQVGSFGSDGKGWLYMAGQTPAVAKRPVSGGAWIPDTVGLSGVSVLIDLVPDRNGNMIGRYFGKFYHQQSGSWVVVPKPAALSTNAFISAFSIDSSGALFAAFTDGYPSISKGVFFTTDWGVSWTYAGGDSILVSHLVSYGDTTYALTSGHGAFLFTRSPATTVEERRVVPQTFALDQNYPNPFNPSTAITYQLPAVSRVTLTVFDILGREVARLSDKIETPGAHTTTWNADRYASGVYFYRLEAVPVSGGRSFVATKKLLLLK